MGAIECSEGDFRHQACAIFDLESFTQDCSIVSSQMNINIGVHRPGATTVFKDPNLHTNSFRKNQLQIYIQGQGNLELKSKVALGLHGHYGNVEVNQGCR